MRATTFGVTHNVILDEKLTSEFLKEEKKKFQKLSDFSKVFYDKNTIVSDVSLNYLNILQDSDLNQSLKNIILKEYYDCEKIYPYLGDYFLAKLFELKVLHKQSIKFNKRNESEFLCNIKSKHVKSLSKWIFNNINLKRSINIETHQGTELAVEVLDDFVFQCSYDYEFFTKLNSSLKNYRIAIINGMIESVSEIHHLLYKASESKEPHVIFCFGMSDEVKHTIIKNNTLGRLKVYPVSLDANDENTLNILSDFAVIQGGSVISSDLGQTISQEVRKSLVKSKEIRFLPNKIIIKPNVEKNVIDSHKKFIIKRIDDALAKPDVKIEPLQNRLKSFTSSRLNVYLPETLTKDKKIVRELDYVLRFMSNLNKNQTKVIINNEMFYIPKEFIKISKEKLHSFKTNLSNIKVFIF